MATAYTSLLGLALPVTGELSGSWGDTVNDSITSLLDSAISGTTSLTTDADVTLTTTTGAANQARQSIILWNPASGTTTRNITAPAQSKIYTVINASGGTQSIVFRGAGPTTGVTIIKGESAVVAWNGSDFIKISNTGGGGSFTNVTISGTTTLSGLTASTALALNASKEVVSVTNTGTGNNVLATSPTLVTPALGTPSSATLTNATGLPISTGVSGLGTGVATFLGTPSSANLAAAVTDETGSGALVFATSPTLVTPALGTPASATLTNATGLPLTTGVTGTLPTANGGTNLTSFTANGVVYASSSSALTTGSALTFDGTDINMQGSAGFTVLGIEPATTIGSSGTNFIHGINSTNIGFKISTAEQMRLTSTGLGIGTSSPSTKLTVYDATTPQVTFNNGTSTFIVGNNSGGNNHILYGTGAYPMIFYTNATEGMRLDSSGNLGLGLTPSVKLHVGGSGSQFVRLETTSGAQCDWITTSSDTYFGPRTNTALAFQTNNAERMRLDSSGNLGIGTSSPGQKLVLAQSGATSVYQQFLNNSSSNVGYIGLTAGGDYVLQTNNAMSFSTGASYTERMRLDASGNLGLGVTPSAWSVLKALQVGTASITYDSNNSYYGANLYYGGAGFNYINSDHATLYSQVDGQHQWATAPSGTAGDAITFTQAMTLDASGNFMVGGTSNDPFSRAFSGTKVVFGNNSGETGLTFRSGAGTTSYLEMGSGSTFLFSLSSNASSGTSLTTVTAVPLIFGTNSGERARITSGGDLLVGTTSNSRGARLRVEGIETAYFTGYGNGYGIGLWMTPNPSATGGTATPVSFQNVSDATVGSISTTASATAYNTSSDYRLKNITGPITTSGAYIDSLNPVEGTWKADGSTFVGLIAHEVQEASRTTVATGVKDGEQMQGMDYSSAEIIANLIAEVKSLRQRLAAAGI